MSRSELLSSTADVSCTNTDQSKPRNEPLPPAANASHANTNQSKPRRKLVPSAADVSRRQQASSSKGCDDEADDIIWGVEGEHGIASVIKRTTAQTYYLIRKKKLPVRKFGHRTYSASRRRLLEYCAGELPVDELPST
jgi:hypothetical protein